MDLNSPVVFDGDRKRLKSPKRIQGRSFILLTRKSSFLSESFGLYALVSIKVKPEELVRMTVLVKVWELWYVVVWAGAINVPPAELLASLKGAFA